MGYFGHPLGCGTKYRTRLQRRLASLGGWER